MFRQRLLVSAAIALSSISLAHGQGRSGRDRGASKSSSAAADAQQRNQTRINQRVGQQSQRRMADGVSRAARRSSVAAEKAAQAVARRSGRDAASGKIDMQAVANSRRQGPEIAATKAAIHAEVHAVISAGLATGQPLHFTGRQRGLVEEVFGDAGLLERPAENPSEEKLPEPGFAGKKRENDRDRTQKAPGASANVNARLANAIRVRRTQISQLRDQAIDSGDPKLMARADQFEKTLDLFLKNQARVEGKLTEATVRSRGLSPDAPNEDSTLVPDGAPRMADASTKDGLIEELPADSETRVE